MHIHYIQHVPFEGLGYIETWLMQHQHTITVTRVWDKPVFPSPDEWDVLIIMGGPMGVYDESIYPWLAEEKIFIADAVKAGKNIIGICLGAQLLADVCGAAVAPNAMKEIGWFPVNFDKSFSEWVGGEVPSEMTVFHWHGDRFEKPAGSRMQASSVACDHQLFTIGENMIGLQFHLEADPGSVASMLRSGAGELVEDRYVQTLEEIAAYSRFEEPNRLMGLILSKICGQETGQ